MSKHLVIIDPQKDFCEQKGSLFVPGATEDMSKLGKFITKMTKHLDDIHITLDQHHLLDIAHPLFWKDSNGNLPDSFTIITSTDIQNGNWQPYHPMLLKKVLDYVLALEASGRYPLCIWPPHCLIGTPGANIIDSVQEAAFSWADKRKSVIDFVAKGSNPFTEHYSAIKAEVVDPEDPSTQPNLEFIKVLEEVDEIYLSGQALSHCLANTVRDIVDLFSSDEYVKKLILLTDTTSSVPGFEQLGDDFIKEMTAKGMQLALTTDF